MEYNLAIIEEMATTIKSCQNSIVGLNGIKEEIIHNSLVTIGQVQEIRKLLSEYAFSNLIIRGIMCEIENQKDIRDTSLHYLKQEMVKE